MHRHHIPASRVKSAHLFLLTLISTKAEAAPVLAFVRETGHFAN